MVCAWLIRKLLPNVSARVTVVAGSPSATELAASSATSTATARARLASNVAVLTRLCAKSVMILLKPEDRSSYPSCGWSGDPGGGHRRAARRGCSASPLKRISSAHVHHIILISSHSSQAPMHRRPRASPLLSTSGRSSHTSISPAHNLMSSTTATSSRTGDVAGTLGASITLTGALDGLVDDLGRRLGLPVRVELRVVALRSDVLVECSFGGERAVLRVCVPRSS